MRVLGIKSIPPSRLILPGNWPEIEKSANAAECKRSIEKVGILHEPIVRKVPMGYEPVCGRHRIAAMLALEWQAIPCKVIECSSNEAAVLALEENIARIHDPELRDQWVAAKVRLTEAELLAEIEEEAEHPSLVKDSDRKRARADAVRRVAEQMGVKPSTIRWRLHKANAGRRRPEAPDPVDTNAVTAAADMAEPPPPEHAPPPVETFGMDMEAVTRRELRAMQIVARGLRSKVRSLSIEITGAEISDHAKIQIRRYLSEIHGVITKAIPTHICPYCKMLDGLCEKCAHCEGRGWVHATQADLANYPPELVREPPMVAINGEIRPADEVWAELNPEADAVLAEDEEEDEDVW